MRMGGTLLLRRPPVDGRGRCIWPKPRRGSSARPSSQPSLSCVGAGRRAGAVQCRCFLLYARGSGAGAGSLRRAL